ncbi:membrane protein [Pontibacillus chungwhensis BH030062]|uniref:Membrane protein n=1 Tax=Pontibacillus chungwhensis BH030062 TaxID=1385513 RepID=A0A0A2UXJ8_9BACI|nr:hypothetical protein [Pontibacillus chungwhensis]KGP91241.1 membrane protein [Pontibacillus chungwhensis BH030062]
MNVIAWMIVACEIGFWVVIGLGLFTRYMLKKDKLGLFLLALTPVIDLLLLLMTGFDLYRGATATTAHAVAAVYIGVSIGFGKSMIEWADKRFQYYITKEGSKPTKRTGYELSIHYLKGWGRHVFSYMIGAGLLLGMIFFIDDASRTEALGNVLRIWTVALGVDLLIAITYFIWPRKERDSQKGRAL